MTTHENVAELHSAAFFGDSRDDWWHPDFLKLMSQRWQLAEVRQVLDVGCGIGHWGRALAHALPLEAHVVGIDREPTWVSQATKIAETRGLSERFEYRCGMADSLEFEDGTFDMVTCQTVLIHLSEPINALREMLRVLKPGGILVVAEPNNLANTLLLDSCSAHASIEDLVADVRFMLTCERGKIALGEGNNSLGDLLPGMFADLGLARIQVYQSDCTMPAFPPYGSPQLQAWVKELADNIDQGFCLFGRHDTERYYLAGGGTQEDFESYWAKAIADQQETLAAVRAGRYHTAGGNHHYLISGRKPVN